MSKDSTIENTFCAFVNSDEFKKLQESAIYAIKAIYQSVYIILNEIINHHDFKVLYNAIKNLVIELNTNEQLRQNLLELLKTLSAEIPQTSKQEFENISKTDILELEKDMTKFFEYNSLNSQQVLYSILLKWKDKNPVIFWIVHYIILNLTIPVYASYCVTAFIETETKIRTEPSSKAPIINCIPAHSYTTIINEVPYYYQIEYYNEKTDEAQNGWVSKRSIIKEGKDNNDFSRERF